MRPGGSTLAFFTITFAVSWLCFLPAPRLDPFLRTALLYLATFAPSLVALGLTAWAGGRPAVRALLGRILRAGVGARWYLFAVVYLGAVKAAVTVVYRLATGEWPPFNGQELLVAPVAMLFSTPFQAGEEIGWRGYALPRLTARIGLGPASVAVGFLWMLWHLPVFFVPGMDNYGQSFPNFVLGGIALSVAMAWLYQRTGGSLLLVMLMHSAANQTVGIVPSAGAAGNSWDWSRLPVAWLTDAFLWIAAVYFLARMHGIRSVG